MSAADGVRQLARDVQRFGLLSATSVVERYVELVDTSVVGAPLGGGAPAQQPADPFSGGDSRALVDSVTRIAEACLGLLDAASRAAVASSSEPGLVLDPVTPGGTTQAWLYVHNPRVEPTGDLVVSHGALVAAEGVSLGAASVSCSPSRLAPISPHGSARVLVQVDVPPDQPSGTYHGFVLVSVAPGEPISVKVRVLPP